MTDKRGPGRPALTGEQKIASEQRSRSIRAAASLARAKTLTELKKRHPEEFEEIYRSFYEELKARKLPN